MPIIQGNHLNLSTCSGKNLYHLSFSLSQLGCIWGLLSPHLLKIYSSGVDMNMVGRRERERERERESYLIRGPFLILLAGFLLKASNHKNGVDMMPLAC